MLEISSKISGKLAAVFRFVSQCADTFNPNWGGLFRGVYGRGAVCTPPEKIGHISQTVKASLTKFSDIFHLPIPLDLSLFGAKSHG